MAVCRAEWLINAAGQTGHCYAIKCLSPSARKPRCTLTSIVQFSYNFSEERHRQALWSRLGEANACGVGEDRSGVLEGQVNYTFFAVFICAVVRRCGECFRRGAFRIHSDTRSREKIKFFQRGIVRLCRSE